jgi:glycine dehydrogenase subunit 2
MAEPTRDAGRSDESVSRAETAACRPAAVDRATIYEKSCPGRRAYSLPELDVPAADPDELIPARLRRAEPARLPEIGELDLLRHFTGLSTLNYGVDNGSYPLGSCTMKYNPRVNELATRLPGLAGLHPYQPESLVQGALELMHELERWLAEIAGLHATTLQPAAGAHGELTGLLIVRAAHAAAGRDPRRIIIPDTAHGTNPASVIMGGFVPAPVASDARGGVDMDALRAIVAEGDIAGLMLTNPNTLGLFDEHIIEIADLVHDAGGLLYYDGANANAVLGISRPGDMGFDIVHFNTHKTFSTPHGGGGPGAGPIVVRDSLAAYLPVPVLEADVDGRWFFQYNRPQSIGKVRTFYGNFGVLVRAWTYIRSLGGDGLREVSETAVLNANYVMEGVRELFDLPYGERRCMHEFVASATPLKKHGVRALDLAKRLLDYGVHPPTTYFPLIVDEALMVEPTETESKDALDRVIEAFRSVVSEAADDPELLRKAPMALPVRRLDEARAARRPVLKQEFADEGDQKDEAGEKTDGSTEGGA